MSMYTLSKQHISEINRLKINEDKKNFERVSIVMPSYNKKDFIERSILSVINQNYPNIELIIVDGGSTDGTIEIIRKYEKNIAFWISEKDNGQSDALNKGFKHCTGKIYGFLNSDDIYTPGAFRCASTVLKNNQNKNIVFGDWLSIDVNDNVIDLHHAFNFNINHFKYEGFHLNAQAMFWRSEVHRSFSGFDTNLNFTMDYQFILEIGINEGQNRFQRIPKVLGAFRRYEGQKTTGLISENIIKEHKLIAKKYNYSDKYSLLGKIKRIYFRLRRAWWYKKRGGLSNLFLRLKNSYVNSFKIKP